MTTHLPPSRLKVHHLVTRHGEPDTTPHPPKRRCACGTVLTWNDDSLCCACRDKEEETGPKDRRSKIPASDYGHILALREIGWTYRELAELYGANPNYLCELITKIRKAML